MDSQAEEVAAGPPYGLKQLDLARAVGLGLLVAALWMATRPYPGIYHDSRFYTAEALNALLPGRLSHDLYFQYGSQGRFTIFSFLYAPLVSLLGLPGANIALAIAAQCLWLSGVSYLAFVLFRGWKQAGMAVMAAILLPSGSLFQYGEPFVTPRLFAEALTLWALAGQLKGYPIRALAILSIALLMHPLMALPGLAVWFFYQTRPWPILWFIAAAAAAAICGLAFAGIQPFSRLFVRFDPAWLEIIRTRERFCFVGLWEFGRWFPILGTFTLGFFELTLATAQERRVLIPIFAVGAGGIFASFIGGDILRNVLLLDIQTWRSIWLFILVANLFAVKTFLRFAGARPATSRMAVGLIALALGLLVISQFFAVASMGAVAILIIAVFAGCWEWIAKRSISTAPMRILVALLVGCALGVIVAGANVAISGMSVDPAEFWKLVRAFMLSLCILFAIWIFLFRPNIRAGQRLRSAVVLITALGLAAIACWQWDQRTPWTKFVDASAPPSDLTNLLPGAAPIYWEGDVATPWFLLKRASYFSCDQGTGVLFSRDTAMAYGARYRNFEKLQTLDFRQYSYCPLTEARRTAPLRRADLSGLCAKEAGLGALVLTERVGDASYRMWVSPVPYTAVEISADGGRKAFSADHFYIYSCAELR